MVIVPIAKGRDEPTPPMIAGVDGCKAGWVAALDDEQGETRVQAYPTFSALLDSPARMIVIDVPIGILDSNPRAADQAARRLLGHRRCCVFSAPYRAMLGARSFEEASAARKQIDGKGCTRQTFGIIGKVAEVDGLMSTALQQRVKEGHPEVTFALMAGSPMEEGKKTRAGRDGAR